MGERCNRTAEVRGSIPLSSTRRTVRPQESPSIIGGLSCCPRGCSVGIAYLVSAQRAVAQARVTTDVDRLVVTITGGDVLTEHSRPVPVISRVGNGRPTGLDAGRGMNVTDVLTQQTSPKS